MGSQRSFGSNADDSGQEPRGKHSTRGICTCATPIIGFINLIMAAAIRRAAPIRSSSARRSKLSRALPSKDARRFRALLAKLDSRW